MAMIGKVLRMHHREKKSVREFVREKAAMELGAAQRDARELEQRHVAHERRLLADVDRERVAARQAAADLAKEQKVRAADPEAARTAQEVSQQALQAEKAVHRDAAATWSRQQQEIQVELATLRERAAGAEQRATELGDRLRRQEEQAEREVAQLREGQAATVAALRQLEAGRAETGGKPQSARAARGKKLSE